VGEISEFTTTGHSVLLHPIDVDGRFGEDEVGVNFHPEDNIYSGWSLLSKVTTVVGANVKKDGSGAPATGHGDNVTGTTVGENLEVFKNNSSNTVDGGDRVRSPLEAARDACRKARDDIIKLQTDTANSRQ